MSTSSNSSSNHEARDLVESLENSITHNPDKKIFNFRDSNLKWRSLTYKDFGNKVKHFKTALKKMGIKSNDKVSIIGNNSVDWAVGAYGAYSSGAVWVPMYEAQRVSEWRYILENSDAKVLIVSKTKIYDEIKQFKNELKNLEHIICLEAPFEESHSFANHLKNAEQETDLSKGLRESGFNEDFSANLIYTSGTTGRPKGVELTHKNVISNVHAIKKLDVLQEGDVSLCFLPWAHCYGQTAELHTLINLGSTISIVDDIKSIMNNLQEVKPTVLFTVPTLLNKFYAGLFAKVSASPAIIRGLFTYALKVALKRYEGKANLVDKILYPYLHMTIISKIKNMFGGNLRLIIVGGAAVDPEILRFYDKIGLTIYEGYGATETAPLISVNKPSAKLIGSVGPAIDGVEVLLLSPDEASPLSPNVDVGELYSTGDNVMKGYWKNEAETEKAIKVINGKRYFKTGDLATIVDGKFIKIVGRAKEQYKLSNGKFVVPTIISETLTLSPFIGQVCVFGLNQPNNVALISPNWETVEKWAATNGITYTDKINTLVNDKRLQQVIRDELEFQSKKLKHYERIREYALISDPFSVENGMLTPKLSIKRHNVEKNHGDLIKSLFDKLKVDEDKDAKEDVKEHKY